MTKKHANPPEWFHGVSEPSTKMLVYPLSPRIHMSSTGDLVDGGGICSWSLPSTTCPEGVTCVTKLPPCMVSGVNCAYTVAQAAPVKAEPLWVQNWPMIPIYLCFWALCCIYLRARDEDLTDG